MHSNLLIALNNIIKCSSNSLSEGILGRNRINNIGVSLEDYIKDAFCDTILEFNKQKKIEKYNQFLSYIGNQNNPPDFMLKNGDAVEVKKIEKIKSQIALNSSYPKDKLYADSPMITKSCRESENWEIKDLIYTIGFVDLDKIKLISFIYGDCYSAEKNIYERIKNSISEGILSLPNISFSPTKELGKVKAVDPLGITDLRIRGMWHIENPLSVFDYIVEPNISEGLHVVAIILENKYNTFSEIDRKNLEESLHKIEGIKREVKIKSPNNPAILLNSILIEFKI